jgi:hypothetical protein
MITFITLHTFTASLKYERYVSEEFKTFTSRLVSYCRRLPSMKRTQLPVILPILVRDAGWQTRKNCSDEATFYLRVWIHQHRIRTWELRIRVALKKLSEILVRYTAFWFITRRVYGSIFCDRKYLPWQSANDGTFLSYWHTSSNCGCYIKMSAQPH